MQYIINRIINQIFKIFLYFHSINQCFIISRIISNLINFKNYLYYFIILNYFIHPIISSFQTLILIIVKYLTIILLNFSYILIHKFNFFIIY